MEPRRDRNDSESWTDMYTRVNSFPTQVASLLASRDPNAKQVVNRSAVLALLTRELDARAAPITQPSRPSGARSRVRTRPSQPRIRQLVRRPAVIKGSGSGELAVQKIQKSQQQQAFRQRSKNKGQIPSVTEDAEDNDEVEDMLEGGDVVGEEDDEGPRLQTESEGSVKVSRKCDQGHGGPAKRRRQIQKTPVFLEAQPTCFVDGFFCLLRLLFVEVARQVTCSAGATSELQDPNGGFSGMSTNDLANLVRQWSQIPEARKANYSWIRRVIWNFLASS
ncbi:unnamed protein product [Protopolystoma xenopodis]|uniref:Uncharacterized protein n=1 Tax=Protopolystoma xenopodis TaxID=117903 RepID=A0A448WL13_9PLAT|nr:unnamed protein product [Protopolystoma xenopodis]